MRREKTCAHAHFAKERFLRMRADAKMTTSCDNTILELREKEIEAFTAKHAEGSREENVATSWTSGESSWT